MDALGRSGQHPEGRFFPDTYIYPKNSDDLDVLRQAAKLMDKQLECAWAKRDKRTSVNSRDVLLT